MHSTQKQDWATCTTKDKWKKPESFTLLDIPQLSLRILMVCNFYVFSLSFFVFTAEIIASFSTLNVPVQLQWLVLYIQTSQ